MEKSIFGWYGYTFAKYATFAGRARRTEFWYFTLINMIVSIVIGIIDGDFDEFSKLSLIFSVVTFLPSIAVGARRLHDIGRTGWWQLLWFVPIIGWIVVIVFFATKGDVGDNQYGPDPKAVPAPELPPNA